MVTIHDVAKRANVSIATVSYALNNKNSVSEKTRALIRQLAEEMGYVPNSLAQGLQSRSSGMIGIIVPDITHRYITAFIKYLQQYARLHDYFLLIGSNYDELDVLKDIIGQFIARKVDGLVLSPEMLYREGEEAYKEVIAQIGKSGTPYVLFNGAKSAAGDSFVTPDVEKGQYELATYLLRKGHRSLVMAGGRSHHHVTLRRIDGFRQALAEYGVEWRDDRLVESGYDFHDGYEAAQCILARGDGLPDAIMSINDVHAGGVYKALKEAELSVPDDISLVGFDDLTLPTLDELQLTTVRIPLEATGRICIESLIRMKADPGERVRLLMPLELVERESVRAR